MLALFPKMISGCRRFNGRLPAYTEGALPPAEREQVAAHLRRCAVCQEEVAALSAVADLLRADPPTAAAPAPDLWASIQSQIMADSVGAQAGQPSQRPVALPSPSPWVLALRALPVASGLAAVVVLAGVLHVGQGEPVASPSAGSLAAVTEPMEAVGAVPSRSDRGLSVAAPIQAARVQAKQARAALAEDSVSLDRERTGGQGAAVAAVRDPFRPRRTVVAQPRLIARAESRRARHGTAATGAKRPAARLDAGVRIAFVAKPKQMATRETVASEFRNREPVAMDRLDTADGGASPSSAYAYTATAAPAPVEAWASPTADARVNRPMTRVAIASHTYGGSASAGESETAHDTLVRDVPADASVSDMTTSLRQRNGLFSYQAR